MSKTYILEPTEVEFGYNDGVLAAETLIDESIFENCGDGCILEVSSYPFTVRYAGILNGEKSFTEDGIIPEEEPASWASVRAIGASIRDGIPAHTQIYLGSSSLPTENCTLTISIYTGEDDPEPTPGGIPGLEDKNVVYTYQMLAQSNMKDICLALKELRAAKDANTNYPENPGYSVMEDMANTLKDIATIDSNSSVPLEEYFNPLEAIAAYIRIIAAYISINAGAGGEN